MGHRPQGRTSVGRANPTSCTGPGARPRRGTPVASYVAEPWPDARPLDRGKPRDENTEGGTQPAHKSLIDRRLRLASGSVQFRRHSNPFAKTERRAAIYALNS